MSKTRFSPMNDPTAQDARGVGRRPSRRRRPRAAESDSTSVATSVGKHALSDSIASTERGKGHNILDVAWKVVLLLTLTFASSCAPVSGPVPVRLPQTNCPAEGLAGRYASWLADTGLADILMVEGGSRGGNLHLRATAAYQRLRDAAANAGIDLDYSLFVELGRLGCSEERHLILDGNRPCVHSEIRMVNGDIVAFDSEQCRGGDEIQLSPEMIKALTLCPAAGTIVDNAGWAATQILEERLRSLFAGKGTFELTKRDTKQIRFTVRGMRNEILLGQNWWEWLEAALWLDSGQCTEGHAVYLRWEATARYGAGIARPPSSRSGYTNNMEPEHLKALVDYVNKVLGRLRDSFPTKE